MIPFSFRRTLYDSYFFYLKIYDSYFIHKIHLLFLYPHNDGLPFNLKFSPNLEIYSIIETHKIAS